MTGALKISVGQYSSKGRKDTNQDFHGVLIPEMPLLSTKGIAIAVADGISSSDVSHIASESAVKGFLTDYFCTSESWSVKTSAQRVLDATNSWLHSQSRRGPHRFDSDRGYVCTLSAMVLKAASAHLFHVGDSRIYRLAGATLEQLTTDHRIVVSSEQSYLARALGVTPHLEIDYQRLSVEKGDIFVLVTDGVYEYADAGVIARTIGDHPDDLDRAARVIVDAALSGGSPDNATIQIVRIDDGPGAEANEIAGAALDLPLPPLLEARMDFDGYRILREIHGSNRSHIYLARDQQTDRMVTLKIPSVDLGGDPQYLKRFLMEEWVARRVNSAHVLRPYAHSAKRTYLYVVSEFIDGRTLTQWMIDNPRPDVEAVRGIVEQIAKGLRAFHRMEMLHQDLRPENIMIDQDGTVKIIDFGSARVAGIDEAEGGGDATAILGTVQYTAPEYFLGQGGEVRSDLFSLGVIAYQMLTGRLPYGADVPKARTKSEQRKLRYRSAMAEDREIPEWLDLALKKAVHPDPVKRYQEVSEFIFDLRHPNAELLGTAHIPLIERNPLLFWKMLSAFLAIIVLVLLAHGN